MHVTASACQLSFASVFVPTSEAEAALIGDTFSTCRLVPSTAARLGILGLQSQRKYRDRRASVKVDLDPLVVGQRVDGITELLEGANPSVVSSCPFCGRPVFVFPVVRIRTASYLGSVGPSLTLRT